jgi:hypothetical protein
MLIDLLRTTTVDSLAKPEQILTLNASETPRDAFIKLVSNNIRSAPVWDDKANNYVGFLDVRDLVSFVVFEQHEEELHSLAKDTGTTEFLDFMLKSGTKMYDMPMSGEHHLCLNRYIRSIVSFELSRNNLLQRSRFISWQGDTVSIV